MRMTAVYDFNYFSLNNNQFFVHHYMMSNVQMKIPESECKTIVLDMNLEPL